MSKRRLLRACAATAALFFWVGIACAQAPQAIPKLEARVNDATGTLTAEQQSTLEEKLAAFEQRKGSQLVVLIVPTTEPEDIAAYSIRVVEAWKLGRKKVDDGALLIVAKNDRRLRIEVGYGLEGALTDATSNRIITETISPLFRQGDYYGGINAGLDQMIRVIDGEPLPEPDRNWKAAGGGHALEQFFPVLLFAVFVGSTILRALFGRFAGSAITGGLTGLVVWALSQLLGIAALAAAGALLASLFLGLSGGRGWSSLPRGGGWGGGFGGFGGGLGGGGGGGFGGGGGGFGGGGASGGW